MKSLLKLHITFFILSIFILYAKPADALEVVYPKKQTVTISAKSTFLVGNIGSDSKLLVNGEPVKTYKDGAFVCVVPLSFGENNFELKSISAEGNEAVLNYKITRPEPKIASQSDVTKAVGSPVKIEEFNGLTAVQVVKNNSPLREGPSDDANRISHLDKGTTLLLDAKIGEYYRVYIDKSSKYWIKSGYFTEVVQVSVPIIACLKHFKYSYDKHYEYFKFKTDMSVPFRLKECDRGVEVTLYYVSGVPEKLEKYVKNIKFENNTLSFTVEQNKLWGYDCYYNGDSMVFRLTREVKIDAHEPLKNLVIAIDPGHGGYEGGAIGPTKVREADIVLDISKRLEKILCEEGAKPFMTRTDNEYIDLYKRVELVKKSSPLFSISIHANALPDGSDPYVKHGTSVYYYHPQAKELAEVIKNKIIQTLGTRDDGTLYSSFVLTRMTSPIAILVETAYMINPDDYEKLMDAQKRQDIAQSIADGLKAYMNAAVPK